MLSDQPITLPEAGSLRYASSNGIFAAYDAEANRLSSLVQCRDTFHWVWFGLQGYYTLPGGRFGLTGKTLDHFADHIVFSWPAGLTTPGLNVPKFAARWDEMEKTLGLIDKTVIYPTTQSANAMVLKLPPFWMANDTTRSFITLFVRMLAVYPRASFAESMAAYSLAKDLEPAITRFMAGYTHPTYAKMTKYTARDCYIGICNELVGLDAKELATKLVKPPVPAVPATV